MGGIRAFPDLPHLRQRRCRPHGRDRPSACFGKDESIHGKAKAGKKASSRAAAAQTTATTTTTTTTTTPKTSRDGQRLAGAVLVAGASCRSLPPAPLLLALERAGASLVVSPAVKRSPLVLPRRSPRTGARLVSPRAHSLCPLSSIWENDIRPARPGPAQLGRGDRWGTHSLGRHRRSSRLA